MKIAIQKANGVELGVVDFNNVQIIRCIKRARGSQPVDENGQPIPWPVIDDNAIAAYLAPVILATGESYKKQMKEENDRIRAEELDKTPEDEVGALARAKARIEALNDPAQ